MTDYNLLEDKPAQIYISSYVANSYLYAAYLAQMIKLEANSTSYNFS